VLVQGKDTEEFIRFTLEPRVLGEAKLGYEELHNPQMFAPTSESMKAARAISPDHSSSRRVHRLKHQPPADGCRDSRQQGYQI